MVWLDHGREVDILCCLQVRLVFSHAMLMLLLFSKPKHMHSEKHDFLTLDVMIVNVLVLKSVFTIHFLPRSLI